MLNKLVSVVLFLHCIVLLILSNVNRTDNKGDFNEKLICLTFFSLLYMMVVVCNKNLTNVGGVPTALLFGLSFICAGVKLLKNDKQTDEGSILKDTNKGVQVLGGIASVVSILLGVVLTFSICKK